MMSKKAVCLISGGMDSFVAAAIAKRKGYRIHALSFDYGQKNRREVLSARKIVRFLGAEEHRIVKMDLSWTRSALTDGRIAIPKKVPAGIPATYVPARNTVFLSLGLAFAETVHAEAIFIGVNAIDYSGYPDCRPIFIRRFQQLAAVATKRTAGGGTITICAPLLTLSKKAIVGKGVVLGVDFSLSWSCYRGGTRPCGHCPSCLLRARGFRAAGIPDPLLNPGATTA